VAYYRSRKKKKEENDIRKWRTGLYGALEGEKEGVEERNEDGENVRAVAVEHSKPRSRDWRAGYHLGLFPKNTTAYFPGPDFVSACVPPPRTRQAEAHTYTRFARNQRQAHLVMADFLTPSF